MFISIYLNFTFKHKKSPIFILKYHLKMLFFLLILLKYHLKMLFYLLILLKYHLKMLFFLLILLKYHLMMLFFLIVHFVMKLIVISIVGLCLKFIVYLLILFVFNCLKN